MSKEWVEEVKKMTDDELIRDIEGRMSDMYYKDLWTSEFLIRIIRKLNDKDTDVAKCEICGRVESEHDITEAGIYCKDGYPSNEFTPVAKNVGDEK